LVIYVRNSPISPLIIILYRFYNRQCSDKADPNSSEALETKHETGKKFRSYGKLLMSAIYTTGRSEDLVSLLNSIVENQLPSD